MFGLDCFPWFRRTMFTSNIFEVERVMNEVHTEIVAVESLKQETPSSLLLSRGPPCQRSHETKFDGIPFCKTVLSEPVFRPGGAPVFSWPAAVRPAPSATKPCRVLVAAGHRPGDVGKSRWVSKKKVARLTTTFGPGRAARPAR